MIELHLIAGGYAGLLLQEDGSREPLHGDRAPARARRGGRRSAPVLLELLATEAPLLGERLGAAGRDRAGAGNRGRALWLARAESARPRCTG